MIPQNRKYWVGTSACKEGSWIPGLESPRFSRCRCSHCAAVFADTAHWTSLRKPPLRSPVMIGDRVAVKQHQARPRSGGRILEERVQRGVVKYVGDLNSPHTNDPVFIGVKLDDPVGEHDGMFAGKRFFSCPEGHGLIVPATEVQLLAKKNQRKRKDGAPKSTPNGSVRPVAHRESGLESMLNKTWAKNRISAVSGVSSSREGQHTLRTPTPSTLSSFRSGEKQMVMSKKMSEKRVRVGGAPANHSNEGDMSVEDVERETSSSPTKLGRRPWRSVPIMSREDHTKTEFNKMRISGASEIIMPTTHIEKSRTAAFCGENSITSSLGTRSSGRKGSKYTSSQFSGLSGALYNHPGSPELQQKGSVSPANSGRIGESSITLVKNVESLPSQRQGDPRSPCNSSPSGSESIASLQYSQPHSTHASAAHTSQTETPESSEETELIFSLSSSSSTSLPPVPPGTSVNSSYYLDQSSLSPDSLNSCATMSWLPLASSSSLLSPSTEQTKVSYPGGSRKEVAGDSMKVQMMTNTYHKLRKALKRGVKEKQWQGKIQEIESSGLYPSETRRFKVLRESADVNMKAATKVKKDSTLLKRRKGNKLAAIVTAHAKIEIEEGKGKMAHNKIMSYPSSAGSGKIRDIKKMARNVLKKTF